MAGFFASRKEQICTDLISTFDALCRAAQHRKEIAKAWRELGNSVMNMAVTQIPDYREQLESIQNGFLELGAVQDELACKEDRSGEDVRDVIERYYVVYRINEEWIKAREIYNQASAVLDEVQKKYSSAGPNQGKYEASLISAKGKKAAALNEVKLRLNLLIAGKDAYNRFKLRRFKHGWQLYGEGIRTASEREIVIFKQIRERLNEIANLGGEGGKVVEQLAEAIMRVDVEQEKIEQVAPVMEFVEPVLEVVAPAVVNTDSVDWN